MRLFKKTLLLAGAFTSILVVIVAATAFLVSDIDRFKPAIEARLSEATGMEVTIAHLRFGILRGVAFEGHDVIIKNPLHPKSYLTIKKLSLGLKTRPLLSKQVIVKRLRLDKPVLHVSTGPDPQEVKIKSLFTKILGLASQATEHGFYFEARSATIKGGEVVFYDAEGQETVLHFRDLAVKLSGLKTMAPTRYALSGRLLFKDNSMSFNLNGVTNDLPARFDPALVSVEGTGSIQNVPGRLVKSYLMPHGPVQALEGTFDISTTYRGNLGGGIDAEGYIHFTSLYIDYPKLFKAPLKADQGTINYALTFKDDDLDVHRFEIDSEDVAFRGSFSINDITSGNAKFAGELSTTALLAKDIVQLLPSGSSPEVKELVKAMNPSGQMEVKRLEVSGPFQTLQSDKEIGPIVTASADFVLRNLGLTFGPDMPPFKDWMGEISYNGRKVTFYGVGGRVGEGSQVESLNGTILDIATENPVADLTIVTRLKAGDFRNHIQRWLNKESPILSEGTIVEGVMHTDLSVVGPLKSPSNLNISGTITLERISITDPSSGLSLQNISGVLRVKPDRIEVESFTIFYGDRPIRITGSIHNYMEDVVKFNDMTVDLGEGLPTIEGLHGSLDKLQHSVVFETDKPVAYRDGLMKAVHARISDLNTAPLFDLYFRGELPASQVSQLATLLSVADGQRNPLLESLSEASGRVDLALNASGHLRSLQTETTWAAQLSFEQMTFPHTHPLGRIRSLSGMLNLTPDLLSIITLSAVIGKSEVTLHGSIQDYLADEPLVSSLTVESSGLEMADALSLFDYPKEVYDARGILTGHITASGPLLTRPEATRFDGLVNLANGYLNFDQIPPLEDLSAKMKFKQGEVVLEEARFLFLGSPTSVSANFKGFRNPVITARARFEHLDLDRLAPPPLEGQDPWLRLFDHALVLSERSLDNDFLRRSVLNLELVVERGTFQSSTFGPLASKAVLKNQRLTVEQVEINTALGFMKGEGYLNFSGTEPTIFGLRGALLDADAKRIAATWGPDWDVVTGTLNASTSVQCYEEGLDRGLLGCIHGHLLVRLNDGYIRKTGVIEPLAEKLQFSKSFKRTRRDTVPVLRYKTILGDFVLNEGLLTTNNFAINGSKIKIATDGQVNLFHDTMDLKVSVLTYNAINQIVHKIPILNLFAEDNKSLVASYYEVSGDVGEPQVISIPNKSMEMTLIRTFHKIFKVPQRIIMAPIELLSHLPPLRTTSTPSISTRSD
ncbi:MAG: AsmA-like C-terminal domain-containing protein [Nitrospinae bacterium]|nr:AsmA-like C-terminal domain-containing protein [Nitrospinota bacterium]